MDTTGSVTRLLDQLRSTDREVRDEAARQIWLRYFPQLLALACQHLGQRIRSREDEHDVLQRMYTSFCFRQQRGDYDLGGRDDLWRLLVKMTLNKAKKVARQHRQEMRDVRREQHAQSADAGDSLAPPWDLEVMETSEPDPAEAVVLTEEFRRRLDALPGPLRQIAWWKFEGYTSEEIAQMFKPACSVRTVERKLELIREKWGEAK